MTIPDRVLVKVDTVVGREMDRSDTSSSTCGPMASQRIRYGSRGRSLEVFALRCSGKMLKNKIEFYDIIKLDLKVDFSEDLVAHCLDSY